MTKSIIQFNDDILLHIFRYLSPSQYIQLNKKWNKIAKNKQTHATKIIENWYLKRKTNISNIRVLTPHLFVQNFNSFQKRNSRNIIKSKKAIPEYIACKLNLNLYSLQELKWKQNKKNRKIKDIISWIQKRDLQQYHYWYLIYEM